MAFRDQMLVCESCGKSFVFTVTEQRRLSEAMGQEEITPPSQCSACRQGAQPAEVREESAPAAPAVRREVKPVADRRGSSAPEPTIASPAAESREPATAIVDEFPLEEDGVQVKLIGTVKWFSLSKGYGFVTMADGQDLFFHRSDVVGRQSTQIEEEQQVELQVRRTDKGLEAFNVSILPVD